MNTTDFLSILSAICPGRDGIVFEGKRWTYGQISERVNRLSHALVKLGLEKEIELEFSRSIAINTSNPTLRRLGWERSLCH